jgi:hypothetical protein
MGAATAEKGDVLQQGTTLSTGNTWMTLELRDVIRTEQQRKGWKEESRRILTSRMRGLHSST